MPKSVKAMLLSGLIFPGSGHLYLKQFKRGYAILGIAIVCFLTVVVSTVNQALAILNQLETEGKIADPNRMTELAQQASENSNSFLNEIAIIVLFACWLIGVIDSYRIGKKLDD